MVTTAQPMRDWTSFKGLALGSDTYSATATLNVVQASAALPASSGATQSNGHMARLGAYSGAALDIGWAGSSGVWLQVANTTNLATNYPLLLNPNGGKVGIGNAAPGQALDVAGSIVTTGNYMLQDSGGTDRIVLNLNSDDVQLQTGTTSGTRSIRLVTEGVARMFVGWDGNVGIGTTSPASRLHVRQLVDSIDGGITLTSVDGTNEWSFDAPNAGYLRIYRGTTAIARFDSSGHFGVGTTSPGMQVTIQGDDAVPITDGAATVGALRLQQGTNDVVLDMGASANTPRTGWIQVTNKADAENNYDLALNPNGGNVGIGDTTPISTLTVNKNVGATDTYDSGVLSVKRTTSLDMVDGFGVGVSFYIDDSGDAEKLIGSVGAIRDGADTEGALVFYAGTNGAEKFMTIASDGDVGIGTTSPGSRFHVKDTSSTVIRIEAGATAGQAALQLWDQSSIKWNVYKAATTHDFEVYNATSMALSISQSTRDVYVATKLGIGTLSPATDLEVSALHPVIRLNSEDTGHSDEEILGQLQFYTNDTSRQGISARIHAEAQSTAGTTALSLSAYRSDDLRRFLFLAIDGHILDNAPVFITTMKSGATQAAAGAAADEIWKTASHATLPDNVLMIGV